MNYLEKLSEMLVYHSLKIQENEKVLIVVHNDKMKDFLKVLIPKIEQVKGIPFVKYIDDDIEALLKCGSTEERILELKSISEYEVEHYDCFLTIFYRVNVFEEHIVPKDILKKIGKALEDSHRKRIDSKKWVLFNYPSSLDAYLARMTYDEFYQYAMEAMTIDYASLYQNALPLKELMERTQKVRIVSKGTDLTFSIEGMPAIICAGEYNIPDGEVYTAPIKNSVNGHITYNTASPYQGTVFHDVSFTFENGQIVECHCSKEEEKLRDILDTDEGARYIGEFALGFHPMIREPIGDILFDEKLYGSLHFTPGRAYQDAFNGNVSTIHWDLVLIQREEYGGGEIYFDDVLIRKDGEFLLPELQGLNVKK